MLKHITSIYGEIFHKQSKFIFKSQRWEKIKPESEELNILLYHLRLSVIRVYSKLHIFTAAYMYSMNLVDMNSRLMSAMLWYSHGQQYHFSINQMKHQGCESLAYTLASYTKTKIIFIWSTVSIWKLWQYVCSCMSICKAWASRYATCARKLLDVNAVFSLTYKRYSPH